MTRSTTAFKWLEQRLLWLFTRTIYALAKRESGLAARIVTVIGGHPATLSRLGSVPGHRVAAPYGHFAIARSSILTVGAALQKGRHLRAVGWEQA